MSLKLISLALGSGDAQKYPAGNKGLLLDRAGRDGLSVPRGILVLHETFPQLDLSDSLIRSLASQVAEKLAASGCAQPYAVRSAFSVEDTQGSAMAGRFKSRLFVSSDEIGDALVDVWHSADEVGGNVRRDILIMSMVNAKSAGVAFSEREFEDDLVNHCEGTADVLVSGQVEGMSLSLPKLRPWEHSISDAAIDKAPSFSHRLQLLLRDVRKVFGNGDWDIEWADDGNVCYLVQIRPVTRPSRRNEAFTLANHREILPDLPSPFMTSLIASCAHKLFDYYREFDSSLPSERPFIEVFAGRPFINLSLLCEMMRALGLPTTLVTRSIGGVDYGGSAMNLGRMMRKSPVLFSMGMSQLAAVANAEEATKEMLDRTAVDKPTIKESVELLQWLYCSIVRNMQGLTAAMSAPLAILRRLGVLEEHNCRHSTISSEMYLDLEPLKKLVAEDESIKADVQRGIVPENGHFWRLWEDYLLKHGHRGVYESDISRPRLRDDPGWVLTSLTAPMPSRKSFPPRTLVGLLTLPIWWQASRAIRAREQVRYFSMLAMERIRRNLLLLVNEKFDDPQHLWLLPIERACLLDYEEKMPPLEIHETIESLEELREFTMPDLVHRFDDFDQYKCAASIDLTKTKLKGVSLTSGNVSGTAAVLLEPPRVVPANFSSEETVLVARSVDAGWIPVFAAVKGVVVEIGGDLSHGSIILREIGLPSITNVRGATRMFCDGDRLLLDADGGFVSRLD